MKSSTASKSDAKISQSQRFMETARMIGCDESEDRFREVVRKVASAPHVKQDALKGKPKSKP